MSRLFIERENQDGSWSEITREEFDEHNRKWKFLRTDTTVWGYKPHPDEPKIRFMIEYEPIRAGTFGSVIIMDCR